MKRFLRDWILVSAVVAAGISVVLFVLWALGTLFLEIYERVQGYEIVQQVVAYASANPGPFQIALIVLWLSLFLGFIITSDISG